ncbi:hypothetical protein P3X46_013109 [Hevea brasiliensis]|uniref:Uncharacterized protein n=1 Tax=Hevea brasiliensis TaxID=3981 RepID=A0ABQ9M6E1_HEVBR|nr:hypothetical protein P3X46_013109 [Hevea brasiliensis]
MRSGSRNLSWQLSFTLFLIATLAYSVQVKYQSSEVSPFEIHKITIPTLMVDLVIYGIAWANEVNLQAPNDAIYYTVACKIRLLASTLAVVLLVLILVPILGWLLLGLWFILFLRVSSTSYQETYRLLLEAYDELKRLSGNAFNGLKRVIGISFDGLKRLIGDAFLRLKRVCIAALDKFKRPIEEAQLPV